MEISGLSQMQTQTPNTSVRVLEIAKENAQKSGDQMMDLIKSSMIPQNNQTGQVHLGQNINLMV